MRERAKMSSKSTKLVVLTVLGILSWGIADRAAVATSSKTPEIDRTLWVREDLQTEVDRYFDEGWQLYQQGTPDALQQSIEPWERAVELYRELGQPLEEANALVLLAIVCYRLGEPQRALEFYNQALLLRERGGDRLGIATILNNIGLVYSDLGEPQRALEYYERALPIFQNTGNRSVEAITLGNIGAAYNTLGQPQQALAYYDRALALQQELGDRLEVATILNNIGLVYDSFGEPQRALEHYERAIPILQAEGNRRVEAITLGNIGAAYTTLGQLSRALEYHERALAVHQELGARRREAITLNNIGDVYRLGGQLRLALDYHNRALSICQAIGDRNTEAILLSNLGVVHQDLGEFQQALDFFDRALVIVREVGNRSSEATTSNNLGRIYHILGQLQRAFDFYDRALTIYREVGNREGEAIALNNLGRIVYENEGQSQQSETLYRQALSIFQDIGNRPREAISLSQLGLLYSDLEQFQQARDYYDRALSLHREVGDRTGEGTVLNNLGYISSRLQQPQQALASYRQALSIYREVGDRSGEATTLKNLALTYYRVGNLEEAITQMHAAVTILEDLRANVASSELRTSYFASVQDTYSFYIELLMELHRQQPDAGYDDRAFHVSERARARSLLELLAEADVNLRRGIPPELLDRERDLRASLNAAALRQQELWSDGTPSETAIANIRRDIQQLETQLQQIEAEIRQTSPAVASIEYPEPLTLEDVRREVLDDETLLLQYSLGRNRSYLWVVTTDSMSSYELPKRTDIEALVRDLRRVLSDPYAGTRDLANAARPLTDAVLAPVVDRLGDKRLLVVADGILQTIPFTVLATPGREDYIPLLATHEIVNAPSASMVATVRQFDENRSNDTRSSAPKTLAVIADPVFGGEDDPRATLRSGNTTIPRGTCYSTTPRRLPGTSVEAETVTALVSPAESLLALEFDANRQLVTSDTLSNYRIVHFATHGCFDEANPRLSALALSLVDEAGNPQDGYLRLHDIYNLNLPAELVVLSACQTAIGDDVRGEGIVGLTRGFFQAGTSRLIASLWSVSDASTAHLMEQFYQNYLDEGMTPSQALRAAQLQMWQDESNREWRKPFYWAAFVFQGEWR